MLMLPFFLFVLSTKSPQARELVTIAVLSALAVASRLTCCLYHGTVTLSHITAYRYDRRYGASDRRQAF